MAIKQQDPNRYPPKGGGTPRITTATASLVSPEYLQIVELLSEGEIEGLVNDGSDASAKLKSIYLDGTPIRNQDGSYNYSGIAWAETTGTHTQAPIPGFVGVQADTSVAADLTYNVPVVRTITDSSIDSVVISFNVSALYKMDLNSDGEVDDDHKGDMIGTTLPLKIELQSSGGSYVEQTYPDHTTIGGKCTKTYERQYPVRLTGSAPWNLRVTKLVADETDPTKAANAVSWASYTTVIDDPQSYPDCATVALEIPASLFSNVPKITHLTKGIKVQIPSNYNPVTRAYTGTWDGTFTRAWTDNPAWCFYDILTNARYGLGDYLDTSNVDKWGLYEIGQYCDELVDNGNGGTEPRFTCNLLLGVQNNAYDVIKDFASIFRAMTYWASGSVQVTQDRPTDPDYLFTPANVIDGMFTYASSAKRSRHTVAIVTWNNPANHYSSTKEYVEDPDGMALYGYQPVELGAFGCTSQGQARRVGQWILFTERLETESVTFQTGLEGAMRSPGSVITIQDPNRSGIRFGGRVVSATTTSLTLDAPITIESGKTYSVSVILPDGSLADASVSNSPGITPTLHLGTTLSAVPIANASWVLKASDLSPEYYRVIGITEDAPNLYTISALKHIPGKYALIEEGLAIVPPRTSIIPSTLAPTGLTLSESLYKATTGIKVRLQASWDSNPSASKYVVRWRRANDSWSQPLDLASHLWEALDVSPGLYQVQVQYVIGGVYTDPAVASYTVLGKTAPPADVTGLIADTHALTTTLSWNPVSDLDLDYYEVRQDLPYSFPREVYEDAYGSTLLFRGTPTAAHTIELAADIDSTGATSSIIPGDDHSFMYVRVDGGSWYTTATDGYAMPNRGEWFSLDSMTGLPKTGISFTFPDDFSLGVAEDTSWSLTIAAAGGDWAGSTLLARVYTTSFEVGHQSAGTFKYRVKAVDTSGNYSTNDRSVAFTVTNQVQSVNIADGSISSQKLLIPPVENLVPNGYSEAGLAAAGLSPEGDYLVQDTANAYEGNWCRQIPITATGAVQPRFTGYIPCISGDQFRGKLYARGSATMANAGKIIASYYDRDRAFISSQSVSASALTVVYQLHTVEMTAPGGACYLRLGYDYTATSGDIGKSLFIDAIELRKCIDADLIIGNTIETSNYSESGGAYLGSGIGYSATAGAKLDSQGPAIKTAYGAMYVGETLLDQPFFRSLNALYGSSTSTGVFYKGSNDVGGVPNIDKFTIQATDGRAAVSGLWMDRWIITATSPALSDNLDGLRRASVEVWMVNSSGTGVRRAYLNVPLHDRGYGSDTSIISEFIWQSTGDNFSGGLSDTATYHTHFMMKVLGVFGWSEGRWFHCANRYSPYTRNSIAPTGGSAPPGGTGVDPDPGGACPAPWVPIRVNERGDTVPAKTLVGSKGQYIYTRHETTGVWGYYEVLQAHLDQNILVGVWFDDGRYWEGAVNHKFACAGSYTDLRELKLIESEVEGTKPGRIVKVEALGYGPVVQMTIKDAHTMEHMGLLGHNALKT